MPAEFVIAQAEGQIEAGVRRRDRLVAELAAIFDVSSDAMGFRLINLGVTSAP